MCQNHICANCRSHHRLQKAAAFPWSFPWLCQSLKAQIWMQWHGVSCSRPSPSCHLSGDPRNYSIALWEHGGDLWDDPRIDLAWLWVGVGGSEGRMGGLSQAAQTMSLVTSENGCAPLLEKPKQWADTPSARLSSDFMGLKVKRDLGGEMPRYVLCPLLFTFLQRMPS